MLSDQRYLLKFIAAATLSFFIGSVHGVLQVMGPVRAWLDSIGSPYGGPGHMIDPLAHAHINLIGGVMILAMATTYYLLSVIAGKQLVSQRMANTSFWWTCVGSYSFYTVLIVFGVWEGHLLLIESPDMERVHSIASPLIGISATIMGIGLWIFLANVFFALKIAYTKDDKKLPLS